MALDNEETLWERQEREEEEQTRKLFLVEQYGLEIGNALSESSLDVGEPTDEDLAKVLLAALTNGSPEQQLKAVQAILAYAKEAGREEASLQSRRDSAVY